MRLLLLVLGVLAVAGCGGEGDHDVTSLVVESEGLRDSPSGCEVFGRILNSDGERTCTSCLTFTGFDESGTVVAAAKTCPPAVPPRGEVDFSAFFRAPDGRPVSCSAFANETPSGFPQVCKP